ncbi:Uncharacterised protein r2_g2581 [Pycnogonum litorale]
MGDGVDLNRIVITISLDNLTRRLTTPSPASENFRVNSAAVIISFLSIVLLASICANCLLIVSITSSHTLRKVNIYLVVLNFAILNVFASVSHVVLSIFFVSLEGDWDYFGDVTYYLCSLHAIVVQVSTVEITLCIVHMCADRIFVLIRPSEYRKYVTRSKQTGAIATTWIISVISCVPIIPSTLNITAGVIDIVVFPHRYGCFMSNRSNVAYCLFVLVVFVLLPVTFIVVSTVYIVSRVVGDTKKLDTMKMKSSYSEFLLKQPNFWNELQMSKLVPVVGCFFLVLYLPFISVQQHTVFNEASSIDSNYTDSDRSLKSVDTSVADTLFTWMLFLYYFATPCVVIYQRVDIRQKLYYYLCCWKSNSVSDGGSPQMHYGMKSSNANSTIKPKQDIFQTATSINTPVLFATAEGLHLRTVDSSFAELGDQKTELDGSMQSNWSVEPKYVNSYCDVCYYDDDDEPIQPRTPDDQSVVKSSSGNSFEDASPKNKVGKKKKVVRFSEQVEEIEPDAGDSKPRTKRFTKMSDKRPLPPRPSTGGNRSSAMRPFRSSIHKLLIGTNKNKNKPAKEQKSGVYAVDGNFRSHIRDDYH